MQSKAEAPVQHKTHVDAEAKLEDEAQPTEKQTSTRPVCQHHGKLPGFALQNQVEAPVEDEIEEVKTKNGEGRPILYANSKGKTCIFKRKMHINEKVRKVPKPQSE